MDTFDYDAAVNFLNQKADNKKKSNKRLFLKAAKEASKIITMLIKEFNVRKIYQWGSLLNPDKFDENSDIDIGIEGLGSVQEYFNLLEKAEAICSFPLEILELERIDPLHKKSIIDKGQLVYEKKEPAI